MKIKTLEKTSIDIIYQAFSEAFSDYSAPTVSKDGLATMLQRRGFCPKHSYGAFDGDKLVSFTLNGVGEYRGEKAIYDTGTGTLPAYRRRKLASKILQKCIGDIQSKKKRKAEQYILEVLQTNNAAIQLYQDLGFNITRSYNYYVIESKLVRTSTTSVGEGYFLRELELLEHEIISSFWDFYPSWQNCIESINRKGEDFKALGIYANKQLVAYAIIDPTSGDIPQIAVSKDHRRKGLGTVLMHELVKLNDSHILKILNTEEENEAMEKFLESMNIPISGHQYEMVKEL